MARNRNRVCLEPGCAVITTSPRCPAHDTRPSYDALHQWQRRQWVPLVNDGDVMCWRCSRPITPGTAWDLGHSDDDDSYAGPEHAACNRAAGGRKAHE